jgi:hypothetical protein
MSQRRRRPRRAGYSNGRVKKIGGRVGSSSRSQHRNQAQIMIILGLVLLVAGFLFGAHLLVTIGIVVLVIGGALLLLGSSGRRIGGRRHYY